MSTPLSIADWPKEPGNDSRCDCGTLEEAIELLRCITTELDEIRQDVRSDAYYRDWVHALCNRALSAIVPATDVLSAFVYPEAAK